MTFRAADLEVNEENRSLSGLGIVFNSDSVPMRVFDPEYGSINVYERISRASLENADMSDVIAAINHDFGKVLGRNQAGTLELSVTDRGVEYRVRDLPNTTYANDLLESVRRGDIRGSSFVFTMDWNEGYEIEERENGDLQATPKKINKVYEMGPVTNPAYPETTAENRSEALGTAITAYLERKAENKQEEQDDKENQWRELSARIRLEEVE